MEDNLQPFQIGLRQHSTNLRLMCSPSKKILQELYSQVFQLWKMLSNSKEFYYYLSISPLIQLLVLSERLLKIQNGLVITYIRCIKSTLLFLLELDYNVFAKTKV
jgi:hypothetical protein